MPRSNAVFHLLAIVTVAIWGTTFVSTKVLLLHGLPPAEIFLLRFAQAYACLVLLCRRRWFVGWRDEGLMLIAGVTGGSLYFLTENTALEYTLTGNVSLVVATAPLLTALLATLTRASRAAARLWGASALALVGVALVVMNGQGCFAFHLAGDLLALSAAFSWAIYQLVTKRLCDRYGATLLTRKVFGYGLLTILVYFLFRPIDIDPALLTHPAVWGNLLFLGLVASMGCYWLWSKIIERLGPITSANYIYLNPVTTLVFSYLFLGEPVSAYAVFGAVCIIAGVYLAVSPGRLRHLPRRPH